MTQGCTHKTLEAARPDAAEVRDLAAHNSAGAAEPRSTGQAPRPRTQPHAAGAAQAGLVAIIARQAGRELRLSHAQASGEAIVVMADEADGRAVRIRGSEGVTYSFSEGFTILKLFIEDSRDVKVELGCRLKTSFLEVSHSSEIEIRAEQPLATIQADGCARGPVRIEFAEREHIGRIFHQNCPALEVGVPGQREAKRIGTAGRKQIVTSMSASGELVSEEVVRGEREYPAQLAEASRGQDEIVDPRQKSEASRARGDDAVRANDLAQALVHYTAAITVNKASHLAQASRAACYLRAGQPDKALEDATRCTELAPGCAEGWLRLGLALRALGRHVDASKALAEGVRLDPRSAQMTQASRSEGRAKF